MSASVSAGEESFDIDQKELQQLLAGRWFRVEFKSAKWHAAILTPCCKTTLWSMECDVLWVLFSRGVRWLRENPGPQGKPLIDIFFPDEGAT